MCVCDVDVYVYGEVSVVKNATKIRLGYSNKTVRITNTNVITLCTILGLIDCTKKSSEIITMDQRNKIYRKWLVGSYLDGGVVAWIILQKST